MGRLSREIRITFYPKNFQEVLFGMRGVVDDAAMGIAARANALLQGDGNGFTVEASSGQRFGDSAFGTARPVDYVIASDDETSAEEAERKILETVVSG